MKISLTDAQGLAIMQACEWAINDDYPMSDPANAQYRRIINKIRANLSEEWQEELSRREEEGQKLLKEYEKLYNI